MVGWLLLIQILTLKVLLDVLQFLSRNMKICILSSKRKTFFFHPRINMYGCSDITKVSLHWIVTILYFGSCRSRLRGQRINKRKRSFTFEKPPPFTLLYEVDGGGNGTTRKQEKRTVTRCILIVTRYFGMDVLIKISRKTSLIISILENIRLLIFN